MSHTMSLADAIISEDLSQVRNFISYGSNLNQLDEYGFTPLIEAAISDNLDIARLLIEYGADVNFPDSLGGTPLHWAAENNNYELSLLLLAQGANPNAYNLSGQPILVMPLLRRQHALKRLLIQAGANLDFAHDFINTKLVGHLFELIGTANLISPSNEFVEVDFEGFYLEVTLGLISESLQQFHSHFAGRKMRQYKSLTNIIEDVFFRASHLIKYQQYRIDIEKYISTIDSLINEEPVIIPIGYEGHAITFVKFKNMLVKCDRREESRLYDNIVFYQVNNEQRLTTDLIKQLIFEKQSGEFINEELAELLQLSPLTELKIPAQISGNCSWANVEACIPILFFLLFTKAPNFFEKMSSYKNLALEFFNQWREWSKDRTLNFLIQSLKDSDSIRKVCKGEILAAILYQSMQEDNPNNTTRIESILQVFKDPLMGQVLQNYVKTYFYEDISEEANQFIQLLKMHGLMP